MLNSLIATLLYLPLMLAARLLSHNRLSAQPAAASPQKASGGGRP